MNVPDELRKLYDDTAAEALKTSASLEEIDDIALAAVLARHEQIMRESAIVEGKPLDLTHHEDPAFIDVNAVEEWLDDDTGDLSAPYEDIRRLVDTYRDAIRVDS
jgi:hypothetical protein